MITAIWLLVLQASLGAFDTLYYHEYRLRLADRAHSRLELRLHAPRAISPTPSSSGAWDS